MEDEHLLIERSKRGDGEAFSQLVRRHEERIFLLAQKVCASAPSEAEDVSQETFVTAYKKLDQFRSASALGTWLHRIAANLCWMRLRKKKQIATVPIVDKPAENQAGVSADNLSDKNDDPARAARKKELQHAVTHALEELPVEQRMVVFMKDIQDMTNEDIARELDLSLPAVKSRLHRAREILRDRLSPHNAQ